MGKPVWGTCAGLIFLADKATGEFFLSFPFCPDVEFLARYCILVLIFFSLKASENSLSFK